MTVLPPHSSGIRSSSVSSRLTRSGLAFGLSILLIATMIGTFAALRVVDRFARLRHDAVVGRDDEDDDVGDLGAAGAHQRERLVAGRVEEHDVPVVDRDVIGADVLRDAAGFALGDARLADRVEQARLAVVDVAHDGDDRRARDDVLRAATRRRRPASSSSSKLRIWTSAPNSRAIIVAVSVSSVELMVIISRFISSFEHVLDADVELVRQVLHRHAFGERDGARDRRRRRRHRRRRRAAALAALAPDGRWPDRAAASADATACPAAADTDPGRGGMPGCWRAESAARAADADRPRASRRDAGIRRPADAARRTRRRRHRLAPAARVRRCCAGGRAGRAARGRGAGRRRDARRGTARGASRGRQRRRRRRRTLFFDAQPKRRRHDAARCRRRRWRRRRLRPARGRGGAAAARLATGGGSALGSTGGAGGGRRRATGAGGDARRPASATPALAAASATGSASSTTAARHVRGVGATGVGRAAAGFDGLDEARRRQRGAPA